MKNTPYQSTLLQQKEGRLICPACGELLSSQDVESFARCPYCDHAFVLNSEMEDFLLKPLVEHWCRMNMNQIQNSPEFDQFRSN